MLALAVAWPTMALAAGAGAIHRTSGVSGPSPDAAPVAFEVAWDAALREPRKSGFDFMGRELQAMQLDDASNPGMLWVQEGLQHWSRPEGPKQVACAGCHGASPLDSMRGVAARHPAWDAVAQRPVTLAGRIAQCRSRHQGLDAWAAGAAQAALALETAVALASRGMPMSPSEGVPMQAWRTRGAALWQQRQGQLNLSCAQCHDERAGRRLGGAPIPPGNAAGYPTYRLEWQAVGPLTRRMRNCMTGVRAEPFAPESDESIALQVFMHWRDRGMPLQAPAVRP